MSVSGLWQVHLSNKLAFDDAWMLFATSNNRNKRHMIASTRGDGSRYGDCLGYHDTAAESIQKVLT